MENKRLLVIIPCTFNVIGEFVFKINHTLLQEISIILLATIHIKILIILIMMPLVGIGWKSK